MPTPALRTAATIGLALFSAWCLAACLAAEEGDKTPPYDRARASNETHRQKWLSKKPVSYQYRLGYSQGLMADFYSGTCKVTPDTSYCDLKNWDEDHIRPAAALSRFFTEIDAGIVPMAPLLGQIDEDPKLFLKNDSVGYYFLAADTSQSPPGAIPYGVTAGYDPALGFPRTIRRLPFGAYYSVSDFTVLQAE